MLVREFGTNFSYYVRFTYYENVWHTITHLYTIGRSESAVVFRVWNPSKFTYIYVCVCFGLKHMDNLALWNKIATCVPLLSCIAHTQDNNAAPSKCYAMPINSAW